jgi:branched-chain amino acid transport system substrate-binding protein
MKKDPLRALALLFAFAAIPLTAVMAADTIKIGAIFAITGPNAFLGAPEDKTARMIVDDINKGGGILGKKVQLVIKDSMASSEKALSFAKQLVEEENVVAIIGPTGSGESVAIKDYCNGAQVPLLSCAAAETIVVPVAKYIFKTPQKDSDVVGSIFGLMKKKGITKIGVVVSSSGFGGAGKVQLEKFAPQYGVTVTISEVYDQNSTDLTALLTKVNAAGVQAIVNWSVEPAQSIIAKNMKQLNMNIPLFQSHGFGNIKFVQAAGAAAEGLIFPCGRLLIANDLPDSNLQKKLLVKYANDYKAMYGEDASTFGGHAYDAIYILKAAIESAKSTDGTKIAEAIEKITNFPGTGGIYNFSATDHCGLDSDSIILYTVKNGKFVQYKE